MCRLLPARCCLLGFANTKPFMCSGSPSLPGAAGTPQPDSLDGTGTRDLEPYSPLRCAFEAQKPLREAKLCLKGRLCPHRHRAEMQLAQLLVRGFVEVLRLPSLRSQQSCRLAVTVRGSQRPGSTGRGAGHAWRAVPVCSVS